MLHLIIDFIGTGPDKTFREILLLTHKLLRGPHCFLNFSEMSLGSPGFNSSPRIDQQFMCKELYEQDNLFT